MFDLNKLFVAGVIASSMAISGQAFAAPVNLVTNGDFSQSSYTSSSEFGTGYGGQGVTGWTGNGGYNVFFKGGTADNVSAANQWSSPNEKMYGVASSPSGGNFVALDGDKNVAGGISQMINGLTVGNQYTLTFDWGAGQMQSRTGNTTEQLLASLGDQIFKTDIVDDASQSFTGWMNQSFTFVADSTSELLSFLSSGTPTGLPPIATLANVSLLDVGRVSHNVPEPASLALLGLGLVAMEVARRRRKSSSV